jgi:LuxR family maltose regulon positive regulatory protein
VPLSEILRTRLVPPRLPPRCVEREELLREVAEGLRQRLLVVVAGAGYGKTTLLAQGLERSSAPWVWCSCDSRLSDAAILLSHVEAGLTARFPGFGAGLRLAGPAEEQVASLCNEVLETIAEDFVIALDDIHLLPEGVSEVLVQLVDDLPANVHIVLVGRAPVPFPLARLQAARAMEITEERLAFSEAEAGQLLRSVGTDLSSGDLAEVHRRTEGWPAGLILATRSKGADRAAPINQAQFDYLAEEVLRRLPGATQEFLVNTCVLGRFSPELAAAVSGRPDARQTLRALVETHLFTGRLEGDGEWYRYHHLLQAVLRRLLTEADPGRAARLHRRAAAWWRQNGDPSQAVAHLLEARDHEAAVQLIETIAEDMLSTPQAETLAVWLESIPRRLWERRPSLVLANAALLLTKARHEASFAEMERALEELLTTGEHERAARVLVWLQQSMITAGTRPARRVEVGLRYVARIEPGAEALPLARILLATARAYGCDSEGAKGDLDQALALPGARASPSVELYARVARAFYFDLFWSSPARALAVLDQALTELATRHTDRVFFAFARMLRLYTVLELGRYEDALADAATLREEFASRGVGRAPERATAWIRATALAALGRWDELAAELPPSPQASQR